MKTVKKTGSLLFSFALIFAIFVAAAAAAVAVTAVISRPAEDAGSPAPGNVGAYIAGLLSGDSEELMNCREYYADCLSSGSAPELPDGFTEYRKALRDYDEKLAEACPGIVPGKDISFEELPENVRKAYFIYVYEKIALMTEKARQTFGIPGIYVVLSADSASDAALVFGESAQEIPSVPKDADITSLFVGGEKIGYVAVKTDLPHGERAPAGMPVMQLLTVVIVLVLVSSLMLIFIDRRYIRKIRYLGACIGEYAEEKSADAADRIEAVSAGNNEITALSEQTAAMIRGFGEYIAEIEKATADKVRSGADLDVATKIQADMLPTAFPERREIEMYAAMTPAKEVGGDFYDFFRIDSDHIGLVMADVSGKGVPAALFMVIAKTLIQDRALMGRSPARVFEYANNRLCENNASGLFVTAWLGVLEISTGTLTYSNAGHEYPAIKKAGGKYELDKIDNDPPLAAIEDMEYKDEKIVLRPGDSVFLYTDGVPDAKSSEGKRFGTDRMVYYLNEYADLPPKELVTGLKQQIDDFSGDSPFDDVTMLCINYSGKQK
ncbi:MAG: PP2C family protein-serine/threonine phosphatase [Ruminiclostridium sp.]|nr:PP2C family protein-serine/threonine phosphatase [Ruminiclostridium sp.]